MNYDNATENDQQARWAQLERLALALGEDVYIRPWQTDRQRDFEAVRLEVKKELASLRHGH